ncbi:MAG: hypothetical protein BWZ10_01168 [candidate division BRC1 bacterium ADurb.BinA364]|nr:MAG: hypothetical protein BWZ10_01168 [candidate division BRC1 bacterium ADurb.BinA364]
MIRHAFRNAAVFLALAAITLSGGCSKSARLDPHQAYARRVEAGKNPATGADFADFVRVAALALAENASAQDAAAAAGSLIRANGADAVAVLGMRSTQRAALESAASANGLKMEMAQNGLAILARHTVAGQEGDRLGYPFDGFYLLLPGRKPLWVVTVDTALVKDYNVDKVFAELKKRVDGHSGSPVAVAVGFRHSDRAVNAAALEKIGGFGWTAIAQGDLAQLYATRQAAARMQAIQPRMESPAGYVGVCAADFWLRPPQAEAPAAGSAPGEAQPAP